MDGTLEVGAIPEPDIEDDVGGVVELQSSYR
jgi:hypothetical protein